MTQIEEATIQKVCPPREGKKWGSINSAEGSKFWGPPDVLRMFLEGEVCQIEYLLSGTKGDLKTIKKKLPPAFGKQSPSPTMTFNELQTLIDGQIMN